MSKIIGIDYGEKRIGLAVSDPLGIFAMPLTTLTIPEASAAPGAVAQALAKIIPSPDLIVVGLPISLNGTQGPMCQKICNFIDRLKTRVSIPIETQDERFTTSGVERMLVAADVRRDRRREVRDKLAAQSILQAYLDTRAMRSAAPQGSADKQMDKDDESDAS
jgi:putative Holliday junction resolvase